MYREIFDKYTIAIIAQNTIELCSASPWTM